MCMYHWMQNWLTLLLVWVSLGAGSPGIALKVGPLSLLYRVTVTVCTLVLDLCRFIVTLCSCVHLV